MCGGYPERTPFAPPRATSSGRRILPDGPPGGQEVRARMGRWAPQAVMLGVSIAASVLMRLVWIVFPAVIDWDESTYNLVASRLLAGELPYTTTLDNKPPLAELLHAVAMLVGGPDPTALRVAAAVLVGVGAWLLSLVAFSGRRSWWQLAVALGVIGILTLIPGGRGWQVALDVVPFFALALLGLIRRWPAFWIMVVASVLPLIRTNWAVVTVVIAVAVLAAPGTGRLRRLIGIVAGALVLPAAIVVVYAVAGRLPALAEGAIALPLQRNEISFEWPELWAPFLVVAVALLVWALILDRGSREERSLDAVLLLSALVLSALALVQNPVFPHHTLQIGFFVPVAAGRVLRAAREAAPRRRALLRVTASVLVMGLAAGATAGCALTQVRQAADTARSAANESDLVAEIREVAPTAATTVLVFGDPNPLYQLGRTPFTPLMSAACSLSTDGIRRVVLGPGVSSEAALDGLLDADPDVVVLSGERLCLPAQEEAELRERLDEHYRLDASAGPSQVWARTS